MMNISITDRGFRIIKFNDLYDQPSSIQESSLATDNAIWIGKDKGNYVKGAWLARMHLNQEQVKELLPILQHFVETGELPDAYNN